MSQETVAAVGNTLLQRNVLETLPNQPMGVVADLHLNPHYDDEDETKALAALLSVSTRPRDTTRRFHEPKRETLSGWG